METYQFIIKSNEDAFDAKISESEILVNGISIALDEIIELTHSSQKFSDWAIECDASFVRIATNTKQVTINQGKVSYFGIGKKKESGAGLFNAIAVPLMKIVTPRLLFNTLKFLAEGNSLSVGTFKITREGLLTKKLFSDKFCSWDWNIRHDYCTKPLHILDPFTGHNSGAKVSFTSPETNKLEEFGFLKGNEANSTLLIHLCLILGRRDDENIWQIFQAGEGAESGGITHLKRNILKLKHAPESALKRRLQKRFPDLL